MSTFFSKINVDIYAQKAKSYTALLYVDCGKIKRIRKTRMENQNEKIEAATKEQNVSDFIPKKEKPRLKMSRYTMMLVPDSTDDAKSYEFTIDRIARYAVLAICLLIIVISLIVSFAVKNYRLRNDSSLQAVIDNLIVEKQTLEKKNEELTELLKHSEETINEYKQVVGELEIETAGLYIPNIKPYKGSALMISDLIVDDAVSYSCLEGAAIVVTANGTVTSITESVYGNVVTVDHKNGYSTEYTIEEVPMVNKGDDVVRGEVLAYVSEDDETFSYAVIVDGKRQEPKNFIE